MAHIHIGQERRIRPFTPYFTYNRETQNISALGKCLPKGEDYRTFFCPLRFLKYLGKRPSRPPLANDGRHRQWKGPRVGLSWKGRCSACPLLANFFSRAGSFGDPIFDVYRCPQTSLFQHLSTFRNSQAGPCPCLQVCDPPIHWVGLSYRSFPYLLKPYQTSDPSLVCRLRKALYGLKQAPRASVCKMKDGHGEWSWIQTELVWSFFVCSLYGLWYGYFFFYVYNIIKAGIVKWEFAFFFHTFRNSSEWKILVTWGTLSVLRNIIPIVGT